ncbi:methylated-DNA--[protein]-cysteine S-methyltransferase [Vulgatibacter sp.]|uniref:methylated-DNA--[protein]-cysteine S-methyltransferase n=1 Tax=Vulgatibacter sp. TaxID=1971226 RepID=UPI003567832D
MNIDRIDSAAGRLFLVERSGLLCALGYEDHLEAFVVDLRRRFGDERLVPAADPAGLSTRLRGYLAGDLHALQGIAVEPGGTKFQQQVWAALREIPPGQVTTYGDLARRLGRPKASRAVGAACGRNPVSIAIPCHRVVGASSGLTGYAGGIERKRWLLAHERALLT